MSAVMVAALKSGSGKTTIACALMQALKNRKKDVIAYKCGPDYIDPMFHQQVIGIPSRNLDTFFSEKEQIRELYEQNDKTGRIAIIEGVMGLFDGVGGVGEEGSAYHLAQTLDIPVVLVLDAHGMGRTMIPVLAGIMQYDVDHRIRGVILNRTSEAFYHRIAPVIEEELSLKVLGFFPKIKEFKLESRHLGLKLPEEIENLQEQLEQAAQILEGSVHMEEILKLAADWKSSWISGSRSGQEGVASEEFANSRTAEKQKPTELAEKKPTELAEKKRTELAKKKPIDSWQQKKIRIGVARDEVFCFYYEENLRLLREAGAELVFFSPLHDLHLPEGICGLVLGGGYPELKMEELAANESMKRDILSAIEKGMPSLAECGGFMYLHRYMVAEDGRQYPMVGAVPGTVKNTGKLVRFGYVEVQEKKARFLPEGSSIKGHEFHYFDSSCNGEDCLAQKPLYGGENARTAGRGRKSWNCIHAGESCWWGFPHLYYPSNPEFVGSFITKCKKFTEEFS